MSFSVRMSGFRELDAALGELGKATARGVVKRVLTKAAMPIAEHVESIVHENKGKLKASAGVGTKLTTRQQRLKKKEPSKHFVEVYVGLGGLVQAITEEFGTPDIAANPSMRPAWDAGKFGALDTIKDDMWDEIAKTAARMAKRNANKAAKLLAKGK